MCSMYRAASRWLVLFVVLFAFSACHANWHVPPGQIKKQQTPAGAGMPPGQAKKY